MQRRTIFACTLIALFSLAVTPGSPEAFMGGSAAPVYANTSVGDLGALVNKSKKEKGDSKDKKDSKDKDESSNGNDNSDGCAYTGIQDATDVIARSSVPVAASSGADDDTMLKEKSSKSDKKDKSSDKDKNGNANDNTDDSNDNTASCGKPTDTAASMTTPATTPAASLPLSEVTGTSTGGDGTVALVDERVVLRIFPWMPSGITFKLRFVDPSTVSGAPGKRVGSMVFRIDAQDASGNPLDLLPAEVNVSARYAERDVSASSEQNITLSRLNPVDNQWVVAPKLTRAVENNYVAASIVEPGVYAILMP